MRKLGLILFTLILLNVSLYSQSRFSFNVTGSGNIGIGNFGNTYGTGFGATALLLYSTSTVTDVTLSVGYVKWTNNNLSFTTVPLMAGFRYNFPLSDIKLYIPGYLGVHLTTSESVLPTALVEDEVIGGNTISLSGNHLGFGIGAGILISIAPKLFIDINSIFNSFSTTDVNSNYISINGGVQFGL